MVKLVDTGDLKSPGHCDCGGSNPPSGTIKSKIERAVESAPLLRECRRKLTVGSNPTSSGETKG